MQFLCPACHQWAPLYTAGQIYCHHCHPDIIHTHPAKQPSKELVTRGN